MPPHVHKAIYNPWLSVLWSALLLMSAALFAWPESHGLFGRIPAEDQMQKTEGTLSAFRQYSNAEGLRFQLSGSPRYFVLSPYSGAEPAVRRAPAGAIFTVHHLPYDQSSPMWAARRSHVVYVVEVNGSPVRTHAQVIQSLRNDYAWAPYLGGVLAAFGVFSLAWAGRLRFLSWRSSHMAEKPS